MHTIKPWKFPLLGLIFLQQNKKVQKKCINFLTPKAGKLNK